MLTYLADENLDLYRMALFSGKDSEWHKRYPYTMQVLQILIGALYVSFWCGDYVKAESALETS